MSEFDSIRGRINLPDGNGKESNHLEIKDKTIVLPKKDWDFKLHNGQIEQVKPIPESWFDVRPHYISNNGVPQILALVCCPKCKDVNAIASHITKIDVLGKLSPMFRCGFKTCRFTSTIYLDRYNDKTLYALALENGKRIELHYTHASSIEEASKVVDIRKWRVIGIGPAIGYHVEKGSKGSVLIA